MKNLLERAWLAVAVPILVVMSIALVWAIVAQAETVEERVLATIEINSHLIGELITLEQTVVELECQLDRLRRVTLTEFRSQGALWVDRLFPLFEEVR